MARNYSSTAVQTSLAAPVTAADTTISVSSTAGFPAAPYILAIDYGAAGQELVLVTGVSGTNLTVTRGYDSTTAQSHDTGAVIAHTHAAIDFREAAAHEAATTGVHGTTGDLVGTGGAQTFTDKTISVDSNTVNGVAPSSFVTSDATGKIDGTASKGIPTGDVVGTTDTQTLTGKTVSADNNTIDGFAASSFVVTDATGKADGAAAQKAIPSGAVVGTSDAQTLTNKSVALGSNTVTGTKAQFDAACTDGDFVYQSELGAWTAYTPTLTNCTGTISYARYQQLGKTVRVQVKITSVSSTGTTVTVSLPVAPRTGHPTDTNPLIPIGTAAAYTSGDTSYWLGIAVLNGSNAQFASATGTSGSSRHWHINTSHPGTWGEGGSFSFNAEYEID